MSNKLIDLIDISKSYGMQTVLDEGDILNVAVRSDRQKEGIGYFLVDSMLKLAEMIGIHIVHLEVREGNGTARRLYERLGFKSTSSFVFFDAAFFFLGSLPALRSASAMIHCSWPLVERNSSSAHASMALIVSESMRNIKLFVFVSFLAILF